MSDRASDGLLSAYDPSPVAKINPEGASRFVLVGDHAGNAVPSRLGALGLSAADVQRHIAWDIGIGVLGMHLAVELDCILISQVYSRLVIDCNRATVATDCIAEISDGTAVPRNQALDAAARDARAAAIYDPYHHAIAAELSRRDAVGIETILVSLHSFTPRMNGFDRPWHIGVLYNGGTTSFALAVLDALRVGPHVVGDNQPYRMDVTDYTVPRHAYAAKRRYVELEIRQDQLATDAQCREWAARLAAILTAAVA